MNARVSQNDLTFVAPSAFSPAGSTAYPAPHQSRGLFARLAALGQWVAEMPRRRAVLDELSTLSDHELADIGLARNELSRVFNPTFGYDRRAA